MLRWYSHVDIILQSRIRIKLKAILNGLIIAFQNRFDFSLLLRSNQYLFRKQRRSHRDSTIKNSHDASSVIAYRYNFLRPNSRCYQLRIASSLIWIDGRSRRRGRGAGSAKFRRGCDPFPRVKFVPRVLSTCCAKPFIRLSTTDWLPREEAACEEFAKRSRRSPLVQPFRARPKARYFNLARGHRDWAIAITVAIAISRVLVARNNAQPKNRMEGTGGGGGGGGKRCGWLRLCCVCW